MHDLVSQPPLNIANNAPSRVFVPAEQGDYLRLGFGRSISFNDSLSSVFRAASHLRPAPELSRPGLLRPRRDNNASRRHRHGCLHLRHLQAAEDFAVLGFHSAYDYFNHLRVKPAPRTDLSGLKLEFDIEYDHALDGAIRLDAAKFPSVSWDAMTFVCGAGDRGRHVRE